MAYLTDSKKFKSLSEGICPFCNWNKDMLNLPPTYQKRYFGWGESEVDGFIPYMNVLNQLSGEEEFYLYNLDKNLLEFYRIFRKYPIVVLRTGLTEAEYFSTISTEPGEKIPGFSYAVAHASTYAIFPKAMNWYIYGEHDIDLARLVSKVGLPPDSLFPCEFYTEEEAMARIKLLDTPSPAGPTHEEFS